MRRAALASLALLALPGCTEVASCAPTTMAAEPADKVDLRALGRSSVLSAELLADGVPVAGKKVVFEARHEGATVYEGEARTDRNGVARFDLKRVDQAALVALARADAYQATFDGDASYCSSSDEARFEVLNS